MTYKTIDRISEEAARKARLFESCSFTGWPLEAAIVDGRAMRPCADSRVFAFDSRVSSEEPSAAQLLHRPSIGTGDRQEPAGPRATSFTSENGS